jgi:hypothetical protein
LAQDGRFEDPEKTRKNEARPGARFALRDDMTSARLRSVFASAVAAALASSVALAACGGSTTLDSPDGSTANDSGQVTPDGSVVSSDGAVVDGAVTDGGTIGFGGELCGHDAIVKGLEKAKPQKPYDYLELRFTVLTYVDGGYAPASSTTTASVGTKCKTATNVAACNAAIDAAVSTKDLFPGPGKQAPSGQYFVVQSGDKVEVLDTKAAVIAFLGTIDTPEEARLVVALDGYEVLCGPNDVKSNGQGGYTVVAKKSTECLNQYNGYVLDVAPDATITEKQRVDLTDKDAGCAVAGRRPEGFRPAASAIVGENEVLAYLGTMHALEAASVPAFLRLADELTANEAPADLVRRAEEAARDEVRHAAGFAWLRGLYGAKASPQPVVEFHSRVRSLEELAIENAVEGCVRETFGALVAGYQAEVASDGPVRRLFATVAEDETRHAELAWDVAAWLESRLGASARERVREARLRALDELVAQIAANAPSEDLVHRCGMPSVEVSNVLVEGCRELFAA